METLLAAFAILLVFNRSLDEAPNWLVIGVITGLSAWIRPDGLTLLGPVLMIIFFRERKWADRVRCFGLFSLGCALIVLPYLAFNRILAGAWWPNTFFAKQAEYDALRRQPLLERYIAQISLPLIGAGALSLPGIFLFAFRAIEKRNWPALSGLLWVLGYLFVYALRLPVTYQHGRYVMPAMPLYFVLSLAGFDGWLRVKSAVRWRRVTSLAWLVSLVLVLLVFWGLGAQAYAMDVAVIESEMVETALWVSVNTPADALIAAHDIGALGYFAKRDLLDLAGLISPEVIPIIRDEAQIGAYISRQGADYLITFPGLYPILTTQVEPVYVSDGLYSPRMGGDNMAVYQWRSGGR
jgi:hypothetical protein